jgi:hypothetical protein
MENTKDIAVANNMQLQYHQISAGPTLDKKTLKYFEKMSLCHFLVFQGFESVFSLPISM